MGGRGGAFGLTAAGAPTPPAPTGPTSATDTQDFAELAQYMSDTYSIRVATSGPHSVTGLDFESVKNAAAGVETIIKEFPQAASGYHEISAGNLQKGVLAEASLSGSIHLSKYYYADRNKLMGAYKNSGSFHPQGTTGDHIANHEAGHLLERALIHKYVYGSPDTSSIGQPVTSRLAAGNAWRKCTYASQVVSEACKAVKKTAAGRGMKNADLIRAVSGYATRNRSETLAECVADYSANGSSAKPLSVAVWNVLKRELG